MKAIIASFRSIMQHIEVLSALNGKIVGYREASDMFSAP